MAKFYGVIHGRAKNPATQCGNDSLDVTAASWQGAISIELSTDDDGNDCYTVTLDGWRGSGPDEPIELASGRFKDWPSLRPQYIGDIGE